MTSTDNTSNHVIITVYWEESSSSGQVNSQAGGNAGGATIQGGSGYGTGPSRGSGYGTGQSTSSGGSSHFSSSSSSGGSQGGYVSGSQGSGGQFVTTQDGNGHFVSNQGGNGQFVTNQSGNGQFVTSQSGNGQFSSNQGSSGQFSGTQGSINGNQGYAGGQNQGQYGTKYYFNTTWTNANGEDLTAEEKEEIKRKLSAAFASGTLDQGVVTSAFGDGAQIVRVRNKTIVYDANHNIISEVETSTEYGNLGHEGEPGSSFNV